MVDGNEESKKQWQPQLSIALLLQSVQTFCLNFMAYI